MRLKNSSRTAISYVIAIGICIIGYFISRFILCYAMVVNGILGFAIFYFAYRFYLKPKKENVEFKDAPFDFIFPRKLSDIISLLLLSIVLSLAFNQILDLVIWLIKI